MSFSKLAAPCLAAFVSFASFATSVAHADESPAAEPLTIEAPAPAPRPFHVVASADYGLVQVNAQAGLRYDWIEADVGYRGYLDSSETYLGAKVLMIVDDSIVVPYLYGQIGNWKNSTGFFSKDDGSTGGALAAGGFGFEIHMGSVASFLIHMGVDHQYGTTEAPTRLEAGLGFGLRL
jgi:hypothetical protein